MAPNRAMTDKGESITHSSLAAARVDEAEHVLLRHEPTPQSRNDQASPNLLNRDRRHRRHIRNARHERSKTALSAARRSWGMRTEAEVGATPSRRLPPPFALLERMHADVGASLQRVLDSEHAAVVHVNDGGC